MSPHLPGYLATLRATRCAATAFAVDLPSPHEKRCVLGQGHLGDHECPHGFHFQDRRAVHFAAGRELEQHMRPGAK